LRPRVELDPGADPERPEREAEAGALEELLDPGADRALQVPRVGPLEADRDVGDREHAVEVDRDGDEPLVALRIAEHAVQEARLPILAGGVESDVVPADRLLEQLGGLGIAVEDVLGRNRARVDEGVDVGDHRPLSMTGSYHFVCIGNTVGINPSYDGVWPPHTHCAASKSAAASATARRAATARLTAFTTARSEAVTMLGWSPTPHTASSSTSAST